MNLLDVHMHTLASGHAYNTIREMIAAGSEGLALVGIADHAGHAGLDAPLLASRTCASLTARSVANAGVELLMGVGQHPEHDGQRSTSRKGSALRRLRHRDLHDPCINPGTELDNTTAIAAPCGSHRSRSSAIGQSGFPVELRQDCQGCRRAPRPARVQRSSSARAAPCSGSRDLAKKKMLQACKKYPGTSSWAAMRIDLDVSVGALRKGSSREADFPEELVINIARRRASEWIRA